MSRELERHWRVQELAANLGVSHQTVTRMFEDYPGVLILGEQMSTRKRKKYRILLIPDSVLQERLRQFGKSRRS